MIYVFLYGGWVELWCWLLLVLIWLRMVKASPGFYSGLESFLERIMGNPPSLICRVVCRYGRKDNVETFIFARLMWIFLARVMCRSFNLCYVQFWCLCSVHCFAWFLGRFQLVLRAHFQLVLCAVCSQWLAASRLAIRFARVTREGGA